MVQSDRRLDRRPWRERPYSGAQQPVWGDRRERVWLQRPEWLLGSRASWNRTARETTHPLEFLGGILEGLAFEQTRQEEVAFLESKEVVVELAVLDPGQQTPCLQFDERRSYQEKLGRDLEVEAIHSLDLGQKYLDQGHQRDLPEINLLLQNELHKEVERTLVDVGTDLVGHLRKRTGGLRDPSEFPTLGPSRRLASLGTMKQRVFSGIQPTGDMHLGNYLGAVRHWVADQEIDDAIFCVVDLHAMTMPYDASELVARTRRTAMLLLAAGLDPSRCLLFAQSQVRAHTELLWILSTVASFGELRRMTQFKDKSEGQESVSVGLFTYPVLMAADILAYDTIRVPVGDDQRQHLELARDLAIRFNARFGDTLVVPTASYGEVGARVMDLQNPTAKMSKSADSPLGTLAILDEPKVILKKFKSAVTDSDSDVRYDRVTKPGVSNLLEIFATVAERSIDDLVAEYGSSGYGTLKTAVAEAVTEFLRPVQQRYATIAADPGEVDRQLASGAQRAAHIADPVMARVRSAVGLAPST